VAWLLDDACAAGARGVAEGALRDSALKPWAARAGPTALRGPGYDLATGRVGGSPARHGPPPAPPHQQSWRYRRTGPAAIGATVEAASDQTSAVEV